MIITDFHTHSTFSTDGISPLEDMVTNAIASGIKIYCITEHMDYDNHNYQVKSFREEYSEMNDEEARNAFQCDTKAYFKEFTRLKEKYKDQVDLRFGMELGLQPHLGDHYLEYTKEYPFDFLIGSLHEAGGIDPFYPEFLKGRSSLEAYHFYFQQEVLCAEKCLGCYDVFGHLDYALRYHIPQGFDFQYGEFSDELDSLMKIIIHNGCGIELNTGGFKYFGSDPNPRISILKRYRELGGEIITIGSDAHRFQDIARNFDKAQDILMDCGFKYYAQYRQRRPEFLPLE